MIASPPLRVLVVDDEAPARRKLLRLLRSDATVQVVGEADSGESAIAAIEKHRPDVVLLDVQMPGQSGFDVARAISNSASISSSATTSAAAAAKAATTPVAPPQIIFVTAHDQYALRAFEVHAFDYLLKPVAEERFREALTRAHAHHQQSTNGVANRLQALLDQMQPQRTFSDRLLIREDSRAHFVQVREISWIEADRNYVFIHANGKKHTLRTTLDSIQETLDPQLFVRINRSSLVRLDAIRELQPWFHGEYKVLLQDKTELRWSRRYVTQRPDVLKRS
jgi:two-component system, LytTR family, response regulator